MFKLIPRFRIPRVITTSFKKPVTLHNYIKISPASKMSRPKRFFTNKMLDYDGAPIQLPIETLRKRCLGLITEIFSNQKTSFQDCDGALYVGIAGVSYMCHYLAHLPSFEKEKLQLLRKGEEYLNCALSSLDHPQLRGDKTLQVSFLLGNGGMNVLAALMMNALGRNADCQTYLSRYAAMADFCLPSKFLSCGSDELFVGRAGYLCGALLLNKKLGRECVSRQMLYSLCQSIVQSGREYARRHRSPCPLMYAYYGTEYLGAAHGLASILQMLLNVPDYLSTHLDAERDVKNTVDYLLSLQTPSGNFPCAMDEIAQQRPEEEELVHWCHGAPGTIYLMAKAYQRWRDETYLRSCLMCGEIVWKKGLLKKGPGICHGVAGNAYVFLLLYQLTHDPKHLHRALQFAEFIFTDDFKRARTPDCPYSLFEGLAGTAIYLADLLEPENGQFPFFDIF